MSKFRTAIKHKPGSEVVINGHVIKLDPDLDGFCEFEVPDDRDDVFARLKEIPEGFIEIAENGDEVKKSEPAGANVVTVDGESVDLDSLDKKNLQALAQHIGLKPSHLTGEAKLRTLIADHLKA